MKESFTNNNTGEHKHPAAAHLAQQVGQSFCHAVVTCVKADQRQMSAIGVQVVEGLLLEVATGALTLRPIHRGRTQGRLQDQQGSQNVFARGLEQKHTRDQKVHLVEVQALCINRGMFGPVLLGGGSTENIVRTNCSDFTLWEITTAGT